MFGNELISGRLATQSVVLCAAILIFATLWNSTARPQGAPKDPAIERGHKRAEEVFIVRSAPSLTKFKIYEPDPSFKKGKPHLILYLGEMGPQDGVDMALRLGRRAFQENPGADGLLLAGGAWLSNAAIPVLEEEFGRPVITNPAASYWAFMRQLRKCSPRRGFGMLIDSLRP